MCHAPMTNLNILRQRLAYALRDADLLEHHAVAALISGAMDMLDTDVPPSNKVQHQR